MAGLLNEGEEVLMFEPFFEYYLRDAQIFDGKTKTLSMIPPGKDSDEWTFDFGLIEKTITKNTKILMLNTPQNPTGKVITDEEIKKFCEIVKKWPNLIVVSDEVSTTKIKEKFIRSMSI
jgi:kynurenine aminotransferase